MLRVRHRYAEISGYPWLPWVVRGIMAFALICLLYVLLALFVFIPVLALAYAVHAAQESSLALC